MMFLFIRLETIHGQYHIVSFVSDSVVLLHHSSMGNVSRAPAYIGVLLSSFFFHKFAIKFDASHDD